jgi:hypothetical protein
MSEFNLIPPSYELRLARLHMLRLSGVGAVVVLVLGVAAYAGLGYWIGTVKAEVAELQQRQEVSARQRRIIADLNAQKKDLNQQWRLLESLRSGMPAKHMMETVQAALREDEVWFIDWRLRRAGIVTEKEPVANQPGYFIIVKRKGNTEDWQSMTHMTIRGQARDHSTLSEFAQRLLNQPDIEDVRVQKTTQSFGRNREPQAVDFDLAIVLNTELG